MNGFSDELIPFSGGFISVKVKGQGPPLVFLHGFLGSSEIWLDFAEFFSHNYQVILVDLPGHGASSEFGKKYQELLFTQAIVEVIGYFNLDKIILVGHSMGGYIAISLLAKVKRLISGLILFHSTSHNDSDEKMKERDRAIKIINLNHKIYTDEVVEHLFYKKGKNRLVSAIDECKRIAAGTSKTGMISSLESMKNRKDKFKIIEASKIPVLYFIGEHDPVFAYDKLTSEAKSIKTATLAHLKNSAHMGFIEEKRKCLKEMRAFLSKVYSP